MNEHDATEIAYKRGYRDAVKEMQEELKKNRHNLEPERIVKLVSFNTIDRVARRMVDK